MTTRESVAALLDLLLPAACGGCGAPPVRARASEPDGVHGRAGPDRAVSGRAGPDRAVSGRAGPDRAVSGRAGPDRAGSERAGSDRAGPPSGRWVVGWCADCAEVLPSPHRLVLPGAPLVLAAGRYRGPLRTALLGYKERGRRDLAPPLADLLGALVPPGAVLVPAPSRPGAARARGGDHVRRLCGRIGHAETWPLLGLRRRARDSLGLDAAARAANLARAVHVRSPVNPPGPVLLVDDVVTTGATLRACARALAEVGIRVAGAAVLCDASGRADRRHRPAQVPATTPPKYGFVQVKGRSVAEFAQPAVTHRSGLSPNRDAHYRAWHT